MNKNELRAQMARHGDNASKLAKALGTSVSTLSGKINGSHPFKLHEMQFIMDRYDLTADETVSIFFTQKVAESET